MKRMTFAEVVAILALLVAVWALVTARNIDTRLVGSVESIADSPRRIQWMLDNWNGTARLAEMEKRVVAIDRNYDQRMGEFATASASGAAWNTVERKIAALEKRIERVEHGFIAATAPLSLPETDAVVTFLRSEIGVERTTSAGQVEVRAVEEKP